MSPQLIWNFLFRGKSAAWTAIFTGVLSIFTWMLYRVSNRSNETARAGERAFMSFNNIGLGPRFNSPTGQWVGQEFSLNWSNSGTTPATDAIITGNVEAWPSELPEGFDFRDSSDKTRAVIGPKAAYGTNDHVSMDDLTSSWLGKSHLYFWGAIVYKDVFPGDPDRLSEFCVEMTHISVGIPPPGSFPPAQIGNGVSTPPGSTAPAPTPASAQVASPKMGDANAALGAFQWQACREHNCYDEGCRDYSAKVKLMREQ